MRQERNVVVAPQREVKEEGRGEPNDYLMYALHIVTAAFIIAMSLFGGPTIDIPTGA